MKRATIILGALMFFAFPAQAGSLDANVYVIHGINGTDLGLDESLAVDVFVGGVGCALTGFEYGDITDAIPLPAGSYDIEVRLSDGSCGGPLAVSGSVDLAVLENASIIASLNEQGSPTLTKYTNDLRATDNRRGRLVVRHNAAAPPVIVRVFRSFFPLTNWSIDNGSDAARDLWPADYRVVVRENSRGYGGALATDPIPLTIPDNTAIFVYAVGSAKNGTFTILAQVFEVD